MSYLKDLIANDKDLDLVTKDMNKHGVVLYMMVSNLETNGELDAIHAIHKDEIDRCFLCNVVLKRISGLKLEDKIDKSMYLLTQIFDISNPGEAVLMLIFLLDFYDQNGRKATFKDIGLRIFPHGYYTHDSCVQIINKYIKTGIAKNSNIYQVI